MTNPFRAKNREIACIAREIGYEDRVPFLCECDDKSCTRIIRTALDDYCEISSTPGRYLTLDGHPQPTANGA